ncbi:MAG: phenylacetate-CoA oxygenase/reductase subunit PaaK [Gammaproteobacteria bacterium]|nr:MAG: phenylacetate-CoA oxygenase/reductase subunit PaaK [Gammaproteobacteria bacterium]
MSKQFYPLRIKEVRKDTEQAVVVTFDVPDELADKFTFIQGQYLTLNQQIDAEEVRRSYSICAGLDDDQLRVAIKHVEGGVFSTWANEQLKAGDSMDVMPARGEFFTPVDPGHSKHYLCICAGSGITPVLSIIKTVLAREPDSTVTLLYGNQRTATMMFRHELAFLKNAYLQRFHWINIFSREPQEVDLLSGRLDNRKGGALNQRLINIRGYDEFFLCGPEAMISEVSRGLRGEGVAEENIHFELFAASAENARKAIERHHARAREYKGLVSEVSILSGGREYAFELSTDGENILDAGLRNGVDLPFSCKGGVCATCKARLIEGEVDMDLNQALRPEEIESGYILTCQSHPISEKILIDFDQL